MLKSFLKHSALIALAWVFFSPLLWGIASAQETDLWDILIRFCNDESVEGWTKELIMNAEAWKDQEICILITNAWPTDANVSINFVDGTVTNDEDRKKACEPEWSKSQFWQYVSIDSNEFTVEAKWLIKTTAKVNFPAWYAWMSYGCVTTMLNNWDQADIWWLFQIQARRWNFVDVIVTWDIKLWLQIVSQQNDWIKNNIWSNPKINVYKDTSTWLYRGQITLINSWNVPQDVTIGLSTNDIIGKWITTKNQQKRILPWQKINFAFDLDGIVDWYKWPISVTANIEHTPVFEFQSDKITDKDRQTIIVSESTDFLEIPWILVWWLILLLLILILVTGKKSSDEKSSKSTEEESASSKAHHSKSHHSKDSDEEPKKKTTHKKHSKNE